MAKLGDREPLSFAPCYSCLLEPKRKPMSAAHDPAMVEGNVLEDTVVPAGAPWGRRLAKGEPLRIIDLEGLQAVDFLCYNAADPSDR